MKWSDSLPGEQEASAPEYVGNWWKVSINSFLCGGARSSGYFALYGGTGLH